MLNIKNCCLVVVDVQGKLAQLMFEKEKLFSNIAVLIKSAKILDIPIPWCQQVPKALGETVDEIKEFLTGNEPIDKSAFSCCGDEVFRQKLKQAGKKQIIICGIETHVCIYQTAMNLLDKEFEVTLVTDAVSSRTAENKALAIEKLNAEGVSLSSTEMALFELLKDAKHPNFKEIAKLIK